MSIVKYKKNGASAEIRCVPGMVMKYRDTPCAQNEVLMSDVIYKNAKKGNVLSDEDKTKLFGMEHHDQVSMIHTMLTKGDCPLTVKELKEIRDTKTNALIEYIVQNYTNVKGHQITRSSIQEALKNVRFVIDIKKSPSSQFTFIRKKLENKSMIFKPKPGIKQTYNIPYSKYGPIIGRIKRYIVEEKHGSTASSVTLDVPPGDVEIVLSIMKDL